MMTEGCTALEVFEYFFSHHILALHIQLATQESGGEVPTPTPHFKLLPNKNNLCAGWGAQTLLNWRGRRTGERQKEGFVLMVNKIFSFFTLSRQISGLKSETTEVARLTEYLPLCCAPSVHFFLTGFTHPPSEAGLTWTLLLHRWMVSKMNVCVC